MCRAAWLLFYVIYVRIVLVSLRGIGHFFKGGGYFVPA